MFFARARDRLWTETNGHENFVLASLFASGGRDWGERILLDFPYTRPQEGNTFKERSSYSSLLSAYIQNQHLKTKHSVTIGCVRKERRTFQLESKFELSYSHIAGRRLQRGTPNPALEGGGKKIHTPSPAIRQKKRPKRKQANWWRGKIVNEDSSRARYAFRRDVQYSNPKHPK